MGSSAYSIVKIVLFLLLGASCSVVVAFDGKLLSRICNGEQFQSWSQSDGAFMDVMNDLKSHTSESPQLDYYCHEETRKGDFTVYGHGVCIENLDPKDCHDCIDYASDKIFKECPHRVGAQIQLMDCRLRYEKYKFYNDD